MQQAFFGVLMIISGLILMIGGVVVLARGQNENPAIVRTSISESDARQQTIPAGNRASQPISTSAPESLTSEEKGRKFEEWVVKRFNSNYFTLKDWRGDKYVNGIYAETSKNPDLELEFRYRDVRAPFAVECKWRRGYEGERPGIEWATDRQIANYKQYAADQKIPVFVVIGVGGKPDDPKNVFVVRLERLKYPRATSEYLARYRRQKPSQDFFYDYKSSELK